MQMAAHFLDVDQPVWSRIKLLFVYELRAGSVASTCAYTRAIDRSSREGYRSIFLLTSLANTRACQSERRLPSVPIKTLEWQLRLSGQRRILHTHPRGMPENERRL